MAAVVATWAESALSRGEALGLAGGILVIAAAAGAMLYSISKDGP